MIVMRQELLASCSYGIMFWFSRPIRSSNQSPVQIDRIESWWGTYSGTDVRLLTDDLCEGWLTGVDVCKIEQRKRHDFLTLDLLNF